MGAGAAAVLAQQQVDSDKVSAGPIGLLIVLLMIVATVFLIRNMNGRLKRLPPDFTTRNQSSPAEDANQRGLPPQAGPPAQEQTDPPPR